MPFRCRRPRDPRAQGLGAERAAARPPTHLCVPGRRLGHCMRIQVASSSASTDGVCSCPLAKWASRQLLYVKTDAGRMACVTRGVAYVIADSSCMCVA